MSDLSRRRFSIHGVGVVVHGDARILEAIDNRLVPFASDGGQIGDLQFTFFAGDHGQAAAPPEGLRTIYDPEDGEVVYDERADRLYMTLATHIQVVCDPVEGHTSVTFGQLRGSDLWLLSHPTLTLPLIEMFKRRGLYSLHAAGVSEGGRCLVLAGSSGAGKTTLAYSLVRAGFEFLGDDLLFLSTAEDGLRVHAFPDEVDLSRTTVEFFPELAYLLDQPKRNGWPKWSMRVDRAHSLGSEGTCTPGAVILPRIVDTPTSRLEQLTADEALLELVPNVLLTEPRACQAHLEILARLVASAACYRLWTGRDFEALPHLLRPLLDRTTPVLE